MAQFTPPQLSEEDVRALLIAVGPRREYSALGGAVARLEESIAVDPKAPYIGGPR